MIRPRTARSGGSREKHEIPPEGNIIPGVPTKLEMPNKPKEVDPDGLTDDEVRLHLLQGGANEVLDFKVKRASIKKIEYFEDLLLEECDRLVMLHDYTRAFECCLRVQTRNPGWPGLDDHVNRVLFAEGSKALIDGDGERGLRLLRELLARKRDLPRPARPDRRSLRQADRAGHLAGPLRARPPGLARARGARTRA